MMDNSGSYIVDAPSPPLSSRERAIGGRTERFVERRNCRA